MAGDGYCALAWGDKLAKAADARLAAAVLAGDTAHDSLTDRDRVLAAWTRRVVRDPNATTTADVDALRRADFGDREIFEITAYIALRLAFSTINDALGAGPDAQLAAAVPHEVKAAVTFGRPPEAART